MALENERTLLLDTVNGVERVSPSARSFPSHVRHTEFRRMRSRLDSDVGSFLSQLETEREVRRVFLMEGGWIVNWPEGERRERNKVR